MPLHRHECESCGHRFRVLVLPGAENEAPTCPVCGGTSSHRLMPLVAVQFKGTGFYKTDHGRKGRSHPDRSGGETRAADPGDAKPSGDSKASDGPKTESGSKDSGSSAKSRSSE